MTFKVGDKVQRKAPYREHNGWPYGDKVMTVSRVTPTGIYVDGATPHLAGLDWVPEYFDKVTSQSCGVARNNDPDTSKKAARVKRTSLRERVAIAINGGHYEPRGQGWTGHELAGELWAPLNSVTPRLAELRRANRIKDSGLRRDGQIVWVVA